MVCMTAVGSSVCLTLSHDGKKGWGHTHLSALYYTVQYSAMQCGVVQGGTVLYSAGPCIRAHTQERDSGHFPQLMFSRVLSAERLGNWKY